MHTQKPKKPMYTICRIHVFAQAGCLTCETMWVGSRVMGSLTHTTWRPGGVGVGGEGNDEKVCSKVRASLAGKRNASSLNWRQCNGENG